MTPQDINPWLSLALSTIAVGGFLWNWLTSGSSKALKEITALQKQVAEDSLKDADTNTRRFQHLETRVQSIESELKHMPDREATHQLQLAVERLNGRIETLDEKLKPVDALGRRLQEFLVRQAAARQAEPRDGK